LVKIKKIQKIMSRPAKLLHGELDDVLCQIARRHTTGDHIHWDIVSRDFIRYVDYLMRQSVSDLLHCRNAIHVVDPHMYTPRVCQQRVRFLLWRHSQLRSKPTTSKKTTPASANKPTSTTTSRKSLKELFDEVAKNLPTIASDSEDDDDTKPMPEVFRSGHDWEAMDHALQSGEAADTQLQKWQDEEVEFYKKTGQWKTRNLEDLTKDDVAQLLDMLDLSEHKPGFKRSDGKLLRNMLKEDVIRRFGDDAEAADILWNHIEKAKVMFGTDEAVVAQRPPATAAAPAPTVPSQVKTSSVKQQNVPFTKPATQMPPEMREVYESSRTSHTSEVAQKRKDLEAYEAWMRNQGAFMDLMKTGDLSGMKRAMFPQRPERPSANKHVDPEDTWGEEQLRSPGTNAYYPTTTRLDMSAVDGVDLESAIKQLESTGAADTAPPRAPVAAPTLSDSAQKRAVPASVAPKRSNRWDVVEYSDDEDGQDK
jgi:hypothetical protein